jgi:hypothetical protein
MFRRLSGGSGRSRYELTVTNDHAQPVTFEAELHYDSVRSDTRLGRRNGRPLWRTIVPANGTAVLRFRGSPR